jgi:hypothetical protein
VPGQYSSPQAARSVLPAASGSFFAAESYSSFCCRDTCLQSCNATSSQRGVGASGWLDRPVSFPYQNPSAGVGNLARSALAPLPPSACHAWTRAAWLGTCDERRRRACADVDHRNRNRRGSAHSHSIPTAPRAPSIGANGYSFTCRQDAGTGFTGVVNKTGMHACSRQQPLARALSSVSHAGTGLDRSEPSHV